MNIIPFQALACPLDGDPLTRIGNSWQCAHGHNFDIASQGYTNLLPVQNKRSRDPGDSKEMVAARRRFLTAGCYTPIAAAINQTVLNNSSPNTIISCLDAGCGEGYYLRQLASAGTPDQTLALLGLDISKWAVLSAAKQSQNINWVVGSNANLPVQTGTLDHVLCVFGFPVYTEFARALKNDGLLLQVDPGADHLRELREIIYPSLKADRPDVIQAPAGFVHSATTSIRFALPLNDAQQIADLLAMTPHLYRANAAGRAKAAALTALNVTVDVRLNSFRKEKKADL